MRMRAGSAPAATQVGAAMTKRTGTDLIAADVHERLRRRIVSLELKPGSRLVEDDISAAMNVGRTPVREALLRLQGEGLVSRDRGWVVQPSDPSNIAAIFETRLAIEGFATRLAAGRLGAQDLAELGALVAAMAEEQSRGQLNRRDRSFHERIVALSGNALLVEMHQRTQVHYWNMRLPVIFTKEQTLRANEQHGLIWEALNAHDPDQAESAARRHIETTFRIVRDALDDG